MWVFTESGFVSVIRHHSEAGKLVVRARDHQSLEGLANAIGLDIEPTPGSDYPYRAVAYDNAFATWLSKQVMRIDYTNYKDRMEVARGNDFAGALLGVWSAMRQVEDDEARR
jgi:hypothetical protein